VRRLGIAAAKRHVQLSRGVRVHLDRGQVFRFRGVGQPVDLGLPPECGQRDDSVVQCDSTAQQKIPAVRIGVVQMPLGIGIQMQALCAHPPTPRLRIVN
jgi:hypothetical protein